MDTRPIPIVVDEVAPNRVAGAVDVDSVVGVPRHEIVLDQVAGRILSNEDALIEIVDNDIPADHIAGRVSAGVDALTSPAFKRAALHRRVDGGSHVDGMGGPLHSRTSQDEVLDTAAAQESDSVLISGLLDDGRDAGAAKLGPAHEQRSGDDVGAAG